MATYYNVGELFDALGKQIEGEESPGSLFSGQNSKYIVHSGNWTITLDSIMLESFTSPDRQRMYARFVNRDGFKFDIYRNTALTGLGHLIGAQDVVIGDEGFDEAFVVKSNKPDQAKALLSNPRLRGLVAAQPKMSLHNSAHAEKLVGQVGEGSDELRFEVQGTIWDVDLLKGLFDLFEETLRQLVQIGSAYDADPNVTADVAKLE